jgi:hypothetical protein
MRRATFGILIVLVLTLISQATFANAADAGEQQILARDLKTLEVPGKVVAVLWTVRPEYCTLQIVFPKTSRIVRPGLHQPSIQAWLLTADGSAIQSTGRAEPGDQSFRIEVNMSFPISADTEAVAVALRVDDQFLIERLPHGPT